MTRTPQIRNMRNLAEAIAKASKQSAVQVMFEQPEADIVAGWSSLVARRAHNPKVVGSNPAPATIFTFISF